MKLVVGLGNPGEQYARTPHNVGFMVVAELAARLSCALRASSRCRAKIGPAVLGRETILLAQPQTHMNLSGEAVSSILRRRKIPATDILVVLDDADLESGRVRVRSGGSSGGHHGLDSIINALGTPAFPRVRVGIGRNRAKDLVDHVLTAAAADELAVLRQSARTAADAVLCAIERGLPEAMNRFNGVKTAAAPS
ncbi:MAG: aminoacyl-tRNA hydrolase [Verrucomicrobiota bacterium]|nr:aminoacyl-tRNA hydrolase [Verrucomicrobiota bacterium]